MSERLTNILGYLTLFAIMGAIWVMFGEDPNREQGARGERTFADMEARINEVASLKIQQGDIVATLEKAEDGWRMKERGGYAADSDKVRAVLRGIALSERREPKTDNRERFDRLGLGDEALNIELKDDTGGLLLEFAMGKRSDSQSGRSLTYIMQERDTRSWLVTELAETVVEPGWWLRRPILDLNTDRVSDVTIGGAWLTRKLGDDNYRVQGKRPSEQAKSNWVLAEPARVIMGLDFEDVRQLANPLAEAVSEIELTTYDGLSLKLSLYEMDGGTWVQVGASFDAGMRNDGSAGALPDAPVDGAAEADGLMLLLRGWVFKLSDSDTAVLRRTRADFLEKTDD